MECLLRFSRIFTRGAEFRMTSLDEAIESVIGLPEMDGFDVAREARRRLGGDVYLVALSGYGQPADRANSEEAGFNEHLVKPIQADELNRILCHHPAYHS